MTMVEARLDWGTEDVAPVDPIAAWEAARSLGLQATLWLRPSEGMSLVGIGRAWAVEATGPNRFAKADAAWRELIADPGGPPGPNGRGDPIHGPVLLGGLGFTGGTPADERWAAFGASSLVLPELIAAESAGRTTVTSVLVDGRRSSLDWPEIVEGMANGAATMATDGRELVPLASHPDRPTWDRLVGLFAGAVGRGRLDKVVLARRLDVRTVDGRPIDPALVLRSLAAANSTAMVYAFGRGDAVFLGATPERLARTHRRAFETIALAGSAPRSRDEAEDARLGDGLLASEKDREEHAVVVGMLRDSLSPIVDELHVAPAPELLRLRTVQHLATPVAGRLRDDAGLLALAGILHPTPAVGGEPRDLALGLIAENEGFERGWYAGPVGWVAADGDGEMGVALRCALLRPGAGTASLFAGCGIVADSDAAAEWEESRMKLRAVGDALGGIAGEDAER